MPVQPLDTAAFHGMTSDAVLAALASSRHGLASAEATRRLAEHGPNQLQAAQPVSAVAIFVEQFKNVLILILLAATIVSAFLGHAIEATAIIVITLFAVLFGFFQDYRAERAIEALRRMAAPQATVVRDGSEIDIAACDLVPGDLLILHAGNRIAADARLIEAIQIETQEAALTGESVPVEKHDAPLPDPDPPLAERRNMVYAGTCISRGRGRAVVVATGMQTEFGRIARMLQTVDTSRTPLQHNLDRLGKVLANVALVIVAAIVAIGLVRGQPFVEMLVFGIALAVAVVPEALPAVVTISLAIGVQRLVKKNSLMRRLAAVETLGSTSVICSDKTGTLTRDEMTVRALVVDGVRVEVEGSGYQPSGRFLLGDRPLALDAAAGEGTAGLIVALLRAGALVSDATLEQSDGGWAIKGDPTEGALVVAAAKAGLVKAELEAQFPRLAEIPFSAEAKRMTSLHRAPQGFLTCAKGAPEVMLPACSRRLTSRGELPLDDDARAAIIAQAREMAASALRVLAIAIRPQGSPEIGADQMVFLGLVGMIDPPRPEAAAAIRTCSAAGIRVIMITGDHPLTAKAVARELGLPQSATTLTGAELERLSEDELTTAIASTTIFARVEPEHKLRIVTALQQQGQVVAMTGDGVNDAPALKKADIGVAMGISGTDVAKDAAAMTLLDDNFSSIVAAVEEGRGIFENIKKYLAFVLSCNIGEIGLMAAVALLGLPLPLTSVQILYVNLATDGLIALALAVDPYEPDLMELQPRNPRTGVLALPVITLMVAGGIWSMLVNLAVFVWMLRSSRPLAEAMTVTFVTLVVIQFIKAYNFRSYRLSVLTRPFANRWLNLAVLWEMALLLVVIYLPALQPPFGTVSLSALEWAVIVGTSLTVAPVLELVKWLIRQGRLGAAA